MGNIFDGAEVISSYSREQAIEDGMLVNVSDTSEAKESGFKAPICLTIGVYSLCEVPEKLKGLQDFKGRLWDTLYLAAVALRNHIKHYGTEQADLIKYDVLYQVAEPRKMMKKFTLWLCFNPHEGFTVMLPEEY